jgi:hypothetical protein
MINVYISVNLEQLPNLDKRSKLNSTRNSRPIETCIDKVSTLSSPSKIRRVPDANTIWTFREALKNANAIDVLFRRFDEALRASGYLATGRQIKDAAIVAAPKQRNGDEEKKRVKQGRIPDGWEDKPAKLHQKDREPRWTPRASRRGRIVSGPRPRPRIRWGRFPTDVLPQ